MEKAKYSTGYGLPEDFYEIIKPYIGENSHVITKPSELILLWKAALQAKEQHPEQRESIAEWTVSAAASSPLIEDNDIFDDIHTRFGSLEVADEYEKNTGQSAGTEWRKVEALVERLKD